MSKPIPSYLRLHTGDAAEKAATDQATGVWQPFLQAFEQVTGWRMELGGGDMIGVPRDIAEAWDSWSDAVIEKAPVRLLPGLDVDAEGAIELYKARQLATAFRSVWDELQVTQRELWRREAELAAGVPVTTERDQERHLAERLEAILKGGVEAVQGSAGALYLLDEATTELKMRACWGLSKNKLLEPARPLRGAVADLEALVGHAVVMEDTSLLPHWRVPEPFKAAACVPVSTPTEPLGTLWIFADEIRDFTAEQTNLVEIIAGRIAAELQREILLQDRNSTTTEQRHFTSASRWQRERLPTIKPLLDDWELAGVRQSERELSSSFYDWMVPRDGSLTVAVGNAEGAMLEAAMTMSSLQSLLRAHAEHCCEADEALRAVNEAFWNSSAGGQFASLMVANVDPETGEFVCAVAGDIEAFVIGPDRVTRITSSLLPLGTDPEAIPPRWTGQLARGESLLAVARHSATPMTEEEQPYYLDPLVSQTELATEPWLRLLEGDEMRDRLQAEDWSAVAVRYL